MSKVIAILGAGTGLGASLARRFGREGFRVALVARRKERLDALAAELADAGIEAAPFPADLADPSQVPALIDAIRTRFGRIDVVEYGPIGLDQGFTPATGVEAATLERLAPLLLLTPVEVFHRVLPEMVERGDGALLMTTGFSAVTPMPYLSGLGPVMAAARNYLYSLHGEVAGAGVYAGTLSISALIDGSEVSATAAAAFESAPGDSGPGSGSGSGSGSGGKHGARIASVAPDVLAEVYWDMYTRRDQVERVHPAPSSPAAGA